MIPIKYLPRNDSLLNHNLGGRITSKNRGEYGLSKVNFNNKNEIFSGLSKSSNVWMSHGDEVESIGDDWDMIGESDNGIIAALQYKGKPFYGVQFHPEVAHTEEGSKIISNYLFKISKCRPSWTSSNFISESIEK